MLLRVRGSYLSNLINLKGEVVGGMEDQSRLKARSV